MSEWISVKDRLPNEGAYVLGLSDDGVIECRVTNGVLKSVWFSSHGCGCCAEDDVITHWMPLPEPPK